MEDLLERIKDWKTTAMGAAVAILALSRDLGLNLTITPDELSRFIVYAIAIGFLLTGGKK